MLASTSIAMSRVLFSIHSLAAKLGSDTAWFLSNGELSRAGWRLGAHEGELIIERDTRLSDDAYGLKGGHHSPTDLRVTRVGEYDDRTW